MNRFTLITLALVSALVLTIPLGVIAGHLLLSNSDIWSHLASTVLSDYLINSLLLMLGVGLGVITIGVPTAWLTACCEFPLRKPLTVLLLLPLAFPAYIIAYTYTGLLDFAGPVQSLLRQLTGLSYGEYWFIEMRSLPGAIAMLTLVLYPYVYLLSRAAFISQSGHLLQVAATLEHSPWQTFFRVSIPMARPAIIAGLSLALMETLADYGTMQYFGVSTFTTGIFRTFFGYGDQTGAAQLSSVLLAFVLVLLVLEKYSRRHIRYFTSAEAGKQPTRLVLQGGKAWSASLVCLLPTLFGFLLPAAVLVYWSLQSSEFLEQRFYHLVVNSFALASSAALLAALLALIMAYARRLAPNRPVLVANQLTNLGYALPGTIVAIGVIIPFAWLDHRLGDLLEQLFGIETGLLLSGTLFALLFAYSVRFLAVASGSIQSGLDTIKPSLDHSAALLGRRPGQVLRQIHVPLLRSSVFTALLVVFVEVLKELPATLILRPFNFNTLAVRAYELASDERLIDAAPASITIVLVGLLPVFLLNRSIHAQRN